MNNTIYTQDFHVGQIPKNDIKTTPPNCNICNGETELDQDCYGHNVSCCYFCGHSERLTKK